jgi:hypothetical protein
MSQGPYNKPTMNPDGTISSPYQNERPNLGVSGRAAGLAGDYRFWLALAVAYMLYRKKPIYAIYFVLAVGALITFAFFKAFED